MDDLKLYRGINNIDDDLIEEAGCNRKPVIHRYYAFAASAAAVLLAVGISGSDFFRSGSNINDPAVFDNNAITAATTAVVSTDVTTNSTNCISTSVQTIPSDTTSVIQTSDRPHTTFTSVSNTEPTSSASSAAVHAVSGTKAVTGAVITEKAPEQEIDYEYEGKIIMKKYAAFLTSLLTLSNATAFNVHAQTYVPENENLNIATEAKAFIEDYDIDLDFNCDGNFDVFDLYAYYRAEKNDRYRGYKDTAPDYIMEKYEAVPKSVLRDITYTDAETGEEEIHTEKYSLYPGALIDYYFTYVAGPDMNYFDTEYYIDNCPDTYKDPMSYDILRHGNDVLGIWDFQRTKFCVKDTDGSYRLFDQSDADNIDRSRWYAYSSEYCIDRTYGVNISPIHEFIEKLRYECHDMGMDNVFIQELIEGGYVDADINSDGSFDMDDVALTAFFAYNHSNCNEKTYFDSLFSSTGVGYNSEIVSDYERSRMSESEWNKAFALCDTAANYCYTDTDDIVNYLAQYYLTYNTAAQEYFDPLHYVDLGYTEYRAHHGFEGDFFNVLDYYKDFSAKYGPGSTEDRSDPPEGYIFSENEINAAFPDYYKNVKSGKLPEPDIDLSGSIDVADYNLLFNLDCEFYTPYDHSYVGNMVRRYPELTVVLDVPQEVRNNYSMNYDFNNNGISCDMQESRCMMMYILSELEEQYNDIDAVNNALDKYYSAHPEIQYYEVFDMNMEKFNKERAFSSEMNGSTVVMSSVNMLRNYISYPQSISVGFISGDANCSGNKDISDVLLIMQSLEKPSKYGVDGSDNDHITYEGMLRADVDGDGVNNMDACIIKNSLLGA
ncbi:MAG: dockerin type I repeat-containing protein [Ruminococcus sp.]|nr:dockerin type I repeat-containing protein [Ruminococcus sp.]